jgi:hypothetical protein
MKNHFEKKKLLIEFVNKSGVSFGTENEVISALSKQCEDNQEYKELLSDIENDIDEYRTTFRQLNIL